MNLARFLGLLIGLIGGSIPQLAFAGVCSGSEDPAKDWTGYDAVRIYVHQELNVNLGTEGGFAWTDTEVRWAVTSAIRSLNARLPSGLPPLVWGGFVDGPVNSYQEPGSIVIAPNLDSRCLPGAGAGLYTPHGTDPTRGNVSIERVGSGSWYGEDLDLPICRTGIWKLWTPGNTISLRAVLMHEFMHACMGRKTYKPL